ncbi:partner and localizer of BRCA2 isoform X3 [Ctenopharyngodon idella]|uniref:partner and localizer of BRCA2 isoform X3 n=1 Tax=Ctenopharyngodon idella TaxID=7959 RepID=UPI002230CA3F|nr:partner and localizer of BRCA2 isoform X3 [Ctenopharyngodon idella]
MSEEILHNEDKETLRRRLEQLKREYERTAQRLQRAEHHDATCRRVQNRDSDRNRFTQIDFAHTSEPSIATSSVPASEYSENHQNLQLRTNIVAETNSSVQKISAIKLQHAEIASTPPLYSPECRRTPAHRLRSKRSRLRLQNKERESDTDISQEKEREGCGDNIREREKGSECIDKEKSLKGVRNEAKKEEKDCEKKTRTRKQEQEIKMMPAIGEKNQDSPIGVRTDCKITKASQELENDGKREGHCVLNCTVSQSDNKLPVISSEENNLEIQNIHWSKKEVNVPLIDLPVEKKIQSGSAVPIQTSSFPQPSEAVQITDKSEEMLKQTNQSNKGYDDRIDIKHSSFTSGILDSCTLVEGLPFPVEYYIRTTRRMAASHSSVDLDAVIYSQLTGGRGRRRLSQSQMSGRGHMTPERSESVSKSTDQARCRGKGQRGRRGRGRRRGTVGRASCAKAAQDCTISHPASDSQADSESLTESKSDTKSPNQSDLVLDQSQVESQPIHSPGSTVSLKPSPEQGVTQDFKHLPDSQLHFDSQLLVDSNLYKARCRGKGQRGRRGRRRGTVGRASCAKAALNCTTSHATSDSQADSESLIESKFDTESPSQSQSVLERPQTETWPIQSPGSTVSLKPSLEQGVTQDFKHLPDSQLFFDSQLLPDSNLYPIFRRKQGQTGRECQSVSHKDDQSPLLPSIASLIQALQEKDTKTVLLAAVDIQDFHLPDDDFGQLKLERLRLSTSAVEPFAQRPLVYNTRQSSRRQRVSGRIRNCEVRYSEGELFTREPPTTSSLEDSLPLCQSDPTDQSQTEIKKDLNAVNEIKTISSDLMDSRQFGQTEPDKRISNETKVESSEPENISELHINQIQKESQMLSENTSLCPVILNLSPSLTPQMQKGQDPLLPSLGMSPHFLITGSPIELRSPLFSSSGVLRSPSSVSLKGYVSPESVSAKTSGIIKNCIFTNSRDQGGSETQNQSQISQETMTKVQNTVKTGTPSQNNTALGYENLNSPEKESSCISENEQERECGFDTKSNLECRNKINCTPENEVQLLNIPDPGSFKNLSESEVQTQNNFEMEVQTNKHSELGSEIQSNAVTDVKQFKSGNVDQTPVETTSLDTSTKGRTETRTGSDNNTTQSEERNTDASNNRTLLHEETVTATSFSDAAGCSVVLQEVHTFKALEGGCVLDLCLVRWSSEDWCICVAGEWSVCLWAQMKGVQSWSLLHTWTFAQPVMSLQVIPDSLGLLCVTLGHLEITETRVLCCPSMDGTFSQNVVCKDTLQAVVGVSNSRLVCCSTPGDQQRVNVLTVTQEGRVVNTLPLVSAKQNIRTLAVVEGEKDALIGWTECKNLLIWSMKSGQLLQTIYLEKTLTMTNCMKGYSYRGVLCVLLQNAGNMCDEESNASLFTLIAMNPLTGKHITLTSINYPDQHKQQLIDGDVLGSGLVAVFQSGHVVVWDLGGSVAKVVGMLDELCRLARWAGPNTLLTGYLNGDVSVFHYKST